MVFNVAYRMLQNRNDAEDVTQDVFFQAYKSLKRFRGESQVSTWLYRIAVNRSLNHQRKKKYERWLPFDFDTTEQHESRPVLTTSAEENPDVLAEKSDTERIVQAAINSLPEQQRVALLLHRYDGLSYEAIAKIMECSVASVESRLHRAKQALVKKLLPLKNQLADSR